MADAEGAPLCVRKKMMEQKVKKKFQIDCRICGNAYAVDLPSQQTIIQQLRSDWRYVSRRERVNGYADMFWYVACGTMLFMLATILLLNGAIEMPDDIFSKEMMLFYETYWKLVLLTFIVLAIITLVVDMCRKMHKDLCR